jgi:hypothetical protein
MSLSEMALPGTCDSIAGGVESSRDLGGDAAQLAASLGTAISAGEAGAFPDKAMRQLMTALVKIYAAKFDEGQRPALIEADSGVSATAVLVTTSALMKASNLEIFELGMWQSWSGAR